MPAGRERRPAARRAAAPLAVCCCLAVGLSLGCAHAQKPPPPPPKPVVKQSDKAWMNARSLCVLPLDRAQVPPTREGLVASMLAGWRDVFSFPDPARVVAVRGGMYPNVDELTVDLTGAVVNARHKKAGVGAFVPTTQSLRAERFSLVAEPMVQGDARANFRVTGSGVRFDLQRNKAGQPILLLADAREGSLHFDASVRDLERLMLHGAKEAGAKRAVFVRSVKLDLRSTGERTVEADLHLRTLVGFIPAGLRFRARVDVDERMNARISNLTCDGDEVLGPLIVQFIRPGLKKHNDQTRPLLAFPSGKLKLRDVRLHAGERVTLDATFGT